MSLIKVEVVLIIFEVEYSSFNFVEIGEAIVEGGFEHLPEHLYERARVAFDVWVDDEPEVFDGHFSGIDTAEQISHQCRERIGVACGNCASDELFGRHIAKGARDCGTAALDLWV